MKRLDKPYFIKPFKRHYYNERFAAGVCFLSFLLLKTRCSVITSNVLLILPPPSTEA